MPRWISICLAEAEVRNPLATQNDWVTVGTCRDLCAKMQPVLREDVSLETKCSGVLKRRFNPEGGESLYQVISFY